MTRRDTSGVIAVIVVEQPVFDERRHDWSNSQPPKQKASSLPSSPSLKDKE